MPANSSLWSYAGDRLSPDFRSSGNTLMLNFSATTVSTKYGGQLAEPSLEAVV